MLNTIEKDISAEELTEIKELVTILATLPKEDRAVLLSNANAFRVRMAIETGGSKEEMK